MFLLSDYDYELPQDRIAQAPCEERAGSKLLHINRLTHQLTHHQFADISGLLRPGDLVVANDTRVVPARLFGRKETGGRVEVFILDYAVGMKSLAQTGFFQCNCLVRASRAPKPGAVLYLGGKKNNQELLIEARVEQVTGPMVEIRFLAGSSFPELLKAAGQIPLPPYIKRESGASGRDNQDYQTVYARSEGAVAAPTAGLHFTRDLIQKMEGQGVEFAYITLHVGYGTFVPVKCQDIRDHEIHSEIFSLSRETADKINRAKLEKRRVVAVGTTSVRTLEFLSNEKGTLAPKSGACNLYIYPGYRFKCVDAMITNFHLPKSTLLMLISAFYDREKILAAYRTAVERDYRFFSYGDAMFIE